MAETSDPRVAVYLDFDNIVMSWYDRVHGRNAYSRDRQKIADDITDPEIAERLAAATVDVGAIIDYAASFGSLMLTRAYADWSAPLNADYRSQLVARAVDLVQLFPAAAYAKNGADIRLAVDTVEDMFRIPDLTHVVIVGGDSDYVPLAQRCRRLGRYVIGMGVTGSTAKSLAAACDEFEAYDQLPGVTKPETPAENGRSRGGRGSGKGKGRSAKSSSGTSDEHTDPVDEPSGAVVDPEETAEDPQETASRLLQRALQLGDRGDGDWLHSSAVKTHMRRMDPSFSEKALGYKSFSDFLKANSDIAQLEETGHERLVRATE
ncbi:NYN domain-containing protein [Brachybacterium muris]|uniref:NYN domain-containing protein n=1 Tax=Brachybacterium muris TaxID=219301 RepID=UPI00223B7D7C|nr:NYN domain-containing protein [Brachybacterium muris]MCT1430428.1 NYN domain-containing protein [Brachybacterium muris]MCT2176770.1 NYN domain-containing protein [Brachybacterium muris]MCT2261720.1 NYN domain-containing protein [Brachybacterium muris]